MILSETMHKLIQKAVQQFTVIATSTAVLLQLSAVLQQQKRLLLQQHIIHWMKHNQVQLLHLPVQQHQAAILIMILTLIETTTRGVTDGGQMPVPVPVHMLMSLNLHQQITTMVNMHEHTLMLMAVQFTMKTQWEIL